MKNDLYVLLLGLVFATGCKKEVTSRLQTNPKDSLKNNLSLAEAKNYFEKETLSKILKVDAFHPGFNMRKFIPDWGQASSVTTKNKGNYWVVNLPGQPTFQHVKQGYRKLALLKDSTGAIQARILEIIPDIAYWQQKRKVQTRDFTGRVLVYDQAYRLVSGKIYHDGKQVGQIKVQVPGSTQSAKLKTEMVYVSSDCEWYDSSYYDAEGVFTVHSEQVCSYSVYEDGFYPDAEAGGGSGNAGGDALAGGGGGTGDAPASEPPPVDLPDQPKAAIDPKAFMNCFSSLPDQGAKETITVYVQEPQPGLPFNYGTNSVGHTAISLTKSSGGQTITQTVGYYPGDTKLATVGTSSKLVNNQNLGYTVSITYNVLPFEFNAIAKFIANPPSAYNLYTYNCTNFVYDACKQGNITLPDPTGNMGMFQTGMTPAALGNSLRAVAPDQNVNAKGGTVGASHGPCN